MRSAKSKPGWVRSLMTLCAASVFVGMAPAEAPVADAAMRGDVEAVRALVRDGADVNEAQGDGMTALHWAAAQDDAELAEILMYAGARLSSGTRIGRYTPLHIATREGSAAVVRILLDAGADPQAVTANSGATPLHLAARSGSADIVSALLEAGAPVDVRESAWGQTPLIFAAAMNRVEVIGVLLDAGADPDASATVVDVVERAAADNAAERKLQAVLQEFKEQQGGGPGWQPTTAQVQAAVDLAREVQTRWPDVPGEDDSDEGENAGEPEDDVPPQASEEASADSEPEDKDDSGDESEGESESGGESEPAADDEDSDAVEGSEADGGADEGEESEDGAEEEERRPLSYAEQVGSWGGLSPLHHAVRQGHVEAALALIEGGADINRMTGDSTTPLLMASINGQWDLASILLDQGADPNLASEAGATPLYTVIERQWQPRASYAHPTEHQQQQTSHLEMMERLLEAGADPDARLNRHLWYMEYTFGVLRGSGINLEGATPFWRASYALDLEAMRLLTKWGADPTITTKKPPQRRRRATVTEEEPAEGEGTAEPGETTEEPAEGEQEAAPILGEMEVAGEMPEAAEELSGEEEAADADAPDEGEEGEEEDAEEGETDGEEDEDEDKSGLEPVPVGGPAIYPIHAVSGVGYGQSFAGNAHRYQPNGWLPALKFLVEEMGADVNARDANGYTALHHAASRGDIDMILYLVDHGADVTVISRKGETTADMANGPIQRVSPYPAAVALLEELGAVNNQNCVSCE